MCEKLKYLFFIQNNLGWYLRFLFFIFKLEIQDKPINYLRIKALEGSIRKDIISNKNSLHRAITPLLMLMQMSGLLPVQGIRTQNTSYLV